MRMPPGSCSYVRRKPWPDAGQKIPDYRFFHRDCRVGSLVVIDCPLSVTILGAHFNERIDRVICTEFKPIAQVSQHIINCRRGPFG